MQLNARRSAPGRAFGSKRASERCVRNRSTTLPSGASRRPARGPPFGAEWRGEDCAESVPLTDKPIEREENRSNGGTVGGCVVYCRDSCTKKCRSSGKYLVEIPYIVRRLADASDDPPKGSLNIRIVYRESLSTAT